MSLQMWSKAVIAGAALAAGIAFLTIRSGIAQEAKRDVLIERKLLDAEKLKEGVDVIKLKADALKLATEGVQKKIFMVQKGPGNLHAIRELATAINEAESDDDRAQAKEKLMRLFDEHFEADMERREQELAEVEKRVAKLRSTLDRRREKKRDILDLQMEVTLNEADGLGLFGGEFGMQEGPWQINDGFGIGEPVPVPMPGAAVIYAPSPPNAPRAPAKAVRPAAAVGGGGYGGGRGGFSGGRGYGGYERSESRSEERLGNAVEERDRDRERERERERGRDRDAEGESEDDRPR